MRKSGGSFAFQFTAMSQRFLSLDGSVIFPRVNSEFKRTLHPLEFVLGQMIDKNKDPNKKAKKVKSPHTFVKSWFLDSCDTAATFSQWPMPMDPVDLYQMNLMELGLWRNQNRLVIQPLGYSVGVSEKHVIDLHLFQQSTINCPLANRNVSYQAGQMKLYQDEHDPTLFHSYLPLQTIHMKDKDREKLVNQPGFLQRRYPRGKARNVPASVSDDWEAVKVEIEKAFESAAECRRNYANTLRSNDAASIIDAKEQLRLASNVVRYMRTQANSSRNNMHRRKLNNMFEVANRWAKFKSRRYDRTTLPKVMQDKFGNFRSPHIWIQNPADANFSSPFIKMFGADKILAFDDPGVRVVGTQQLSSGHKVQIGVGFEHRIRYWQGQISILQSTRDKQVELLDDIIKLRKSVQDQMEVLDSLAADITNKGQVFKNHATLTGPMDELAARRITLEAALQKHRSAAENSDGKNYTTLIKVLCDKYVEYAKSVRLDHARFSSNFDVYATSSFNSIDANKKKAKLGLPGKFDFYFFYFFEIADTKKTNRPHQIGIGNGRTRRDSPPYHNHDVQEIAECGCLGWIRRHDEPAQLGARRATRPFESNSKQPVRDRVMQHHHLLLWSTESHQGLQDVQVHESSLLRPFRVRSRCQVFPHGTRPQSMCNDRKHDMDDRFQFGAVRD